MSDAPRRRSLRAIQKLGSASKATIARRIQMSAEARAIPTRYSPRRTMVSKKTRPWSKVISTDGFGGGGGSGECMGCSERIQEGGRLEYSVFKWEMNLREGGRCRSAFILQSGGGVC